MMTRSLHEFPNPQEKLAMSQAPLETGSSYGGLQDGQVVEGVSLYSLLAAMRVMARGNGIFHVETAHHRWRMLAQRGGLVLMEEESQAIPALLRKLENRGIRFARVPEWEHHPSDRPQCYPFVSQVYKRYPEITKDVLKEILMENLLALHLEDRFSFVWRPMGDFSVALPCWQLPLLEQGANREAKQWESFESVKHPFQRVQLLDAANMLARVGNDNFPLFARVTTGQHRISEIADSFKQPIFRTALLLDKLAQKKIVSILPLPARESKEALGSPPTADAPEAVLGDEETPKVFVVDDSPVLLRQFRDLLTGWGYRVDLTDDATVATQKMLEYMPSIVFLDVNMPGLSGFELIKRIRREPDLAAIPLVLVTAENSMTNNLRAKWANCRFLAKPRSPEDAEHFREQLRGLLRELAPLPTDVLI